MDVRKLTLKQAIDGLSAGTFSAEELARSWLTTIRESDSALNSFVTLDEEYTLAQAREADRKRTSGEVLPLAGVPVAYKDIFCTQGLKTTACSKILGNFVPPYESTVTQKLKEAGAICLGKTNMDEFAMGSSNESSFFGPARNPWDTDRVPGGSSGGSAAAVAAGLAPAALGTDTGGSIRQPAAFCGITGMKPTYGRVSRRGIIAFASSLDQAGPMTRTAEDAAILLNHMCGRDPWDSTSSSEAVPDFTAELANSLKGKVLGLPKEYFAGELDSGIADALDAARKVLEQMGVTFREISLPHTHLAVPAYYVIAPAEASANLARYDGVRFGYRCENPQNLDDLYTRSRAEGFGEEVKRRILVGTYALSAGYYDAYYRKAQQIRRLIRDDFLKAFEEVDAIFCPTTPDVAFRLGEKTDDPVKMYQEDLFTIPVSLAGLPALSMPCGLVNGLPAGVQLVAPHFEESRLLNIAHQFQTETDWHTLQPGQKGA
ncbi:MAG: Asp-tRNA(Asn)/Glu-tRNA(Gln) amidotransferase subunit GatA [Gammaproteobacteria bacterium]|nr:MAG: Asp-tRNA(Asn)/Glu-tRNA(Gln) amidotransferase subunit GatA [Gammaproteobacteria bacterium]